MSDLISRREAIDELDKGVWGKEWDKALAKTMLESLPSAQPEGCPYYIENKHDRGDDSLCRLFRREVNFGAKMETEQ